MQHIFLAIGALAASPLIDDEFASRQLQRDLFDTVVCVSEAGSATGIVVWCNELPSSTELPRIEVYILTAYHCVDTDLPITIRLASSKSTSRYREQFPAELVAFNDPADVAVLRAETTHAIPWSKVVPPDRLPEGKLKGLSIGCSGGNYPSIRSEPIVGREIRVDKAGSLWVSTRPPPGGRSGGPLVSLDTASGSYGHVLGICVLRVGSKGYYCDTYAMHDCMRRAGIPADVIRGSNPSMLLELDFLVTVILICVLTYFAAKLRL